MTESLTPNEIRADFAQRLQRRINDMARTAKDPAPWEILSCVVELMLAECNGEEEES